MQAIQKRPWNYEGWLWLVPAIAGLWLTVLTVFILPPNRTLHNLFDFAFKVVPLVLAILTIALFPQRNHGPAGCCSWAFSFTWATSIQPTSSRSTG